MERAKVRKEEVIEDDIRFLAVCIETKNAVLVLLSEGEDQLGTLAAAVPSTTQAKSHHLPSSLLLGERSATIARALAERLAHKTGKIGLVSLNLKTSETKASPIVVKLLEKVTTRKALNKDLEEKSTIS